VRRLLLVFPLIACGACVGVQDLGDHPSGATDASSDSVVTDSGADSIATDSMTTDAGAGETVLIPAGSFNVAWGGNKWNGRTSTAKITHDFWVDAHEVTVGQFRAWLDASMPAPCPGAKCSLEPGGPYAETMRWYPSDDSAVGATMYKGTGCEKAMFIAEKNDKTTFDGDERLPMNCVTFAQAVAVCHFRGMRLLTEVEWHYVASGRGQQRTYPWGEPSPTSCTQAIFGLDTSGANKCGFPKPVMTAPGDVSRDGIHDLAGSVSEWTFSTEGPYVPPEVLPDDYAGAVRTDDGVTSRGGRFPSSPSELATTFSMTRNAKYAYADLGFRCAKTKL